MKVVIISSYIHVVHILLRKLALVSLTDRVKFLKTEDGRDKLVIELPAERRNAGDFAAFAGYAQPIGLIDDLRIEGDSEGTVDLDRMIREALRLHYMPHAAMTEDEQQRYVDLIEELGERGYTLLIDRQTGRARFEHATPERIERLAEGDTDEA